MPRQSKAIVEYRRYDLSINFPILLLDGDYWRISPVPSGRLHFHNCMELGVCLSDHGFMEFGDRKVAFREGDVVCVPKHLPHTTYSDPDCRSRWAYIFFDPELLFKDFFHHTAADLDLFASAPSQQLPHFLNKASYPKVYSLAVMLIEELNRHELNYETSVRCLLLSLYIEILRIQSSKVQLTDREGDTQSLSILPALDYIHQNYMQQFSIAHLADLCSLSETHFRRTFFKIMDTSPLEYVNSVRIEKACTLLRSSCLSVAEIATKVGFGSISSFNRCFLTSMGMTATNWKHKVVASNEHLELQSIKALQGWLYPEKLD